MRRTKKPPTERTPLRYMTEFLRLVVATGYVVDSIKTDRVAQVNCLLISPPGRGKTTALERLRSGNAPLRFQSDITWRGMIGLLYDTRNNHWTHIVFPEFQKLFQRRRDVWENVIGLLAQAMEEGVNEVDVGEETLNLEGARIGLLAAMTSHTLHKHHAYFREMGLLSRTLVIRWDPHERYFAKERRRLQDGHMIANKPIKMPSMLDKPRHIKLSAAVARQVDGFIYDVVGFPPKDFRPGAMARIMVCAAAFLRDPNLARTANRSDVDYALHGYESFWRNAREFQNPVPRKG